MEKIRKMVAVLVLCFVCSFAINTNSATKKTEIFYGFSKCAKSDKDSRYLLGANIAYDACMSIALAGTGITLGASIIVGAASTL